MYDLILHPEYEALLKEIEGLKNDVVMIQTRVDRIKNVDALVLRTEYNRYFGELEQEVISKYYRYCLLKRKLEMIQAAVNRGKEPEMASIDKILEAEADEYNAHLRFRAAEIRRLSTVTFTELSDDDAAQAKVLYQQIVRALHPDLNPGATEADCENLQQAVEAFAVGDVATLEAVAAVLELSGKMNPKSDGSMEELKKHRDHLASTAEKLADQLKKCKNEFPMNHEALLQDKNLINEKIVALKKESEEYDGIIESFIQRIAPFEKGDSTDSDAMGDNSINNNLAG